MDTTPYFPDPPDDGHPDGRPKGKPDSAGSLTVEEEAFWAQRDADDARARAAATADAQSWFNCPPTGRQWWTRVNAEVERLGLSLIGEGYLVDLAMFRLVESYGPDSAFPIDIADDRNPLTDPRWWPTWSGRRAWDPVFVAARTVEWAIAAAAENARPEDALRPRPPREG